MGDKIMFLHSGTGGRETAVTRSWHALEESDGDVGISFLLCWLVLRPCFSWLEETNHRPDHMWIQGYSRLSMKIQLLREKV